MNVNYPLPKGLMPRMHSTSAAGFRVSGSVIAEQVRTIDLSQRWWRSTEACLPAAVVDQVVATLNLIIGG